MEEKTVFQTVRKIVDAAGESGETEVLLDISKEAGYLLKEEYTYIISGYD